MKWFLLGFGYGQAVAPCAGNARSTVGVVVSLLEAIDGTPVDIVNYASNQSMVS